MSPDWWRDCRDGIEKCSSPTGDGNSLTSSFVRSLFKLRNVVPRQGTETKNTCYSVVKVQIEKCSSPTGDGNSETFVVNVIVVLRNVVPRQGTETSLPFFSETFVVLRNVVPRQGTETIDVCCTNIVCRLRNVVPRQGTEKMLQELDSGNMEAIEKCSSPTGDGNK